LPSELADGVDQHWYGVGLCRCSSTNPADKAAVAHVRTIRADTDNVISRGDIDAGYVAQRQVAATGGVEPKRSNTDGRVVEAGGVVLER